MDSVEQFLEHIVKGGPIASANPDYGYMPGFENTHSTQAQPGALPVGRNSPQQPPLGLYAEQISGTAFTAPRATNQRSWLYRILPSVRHMHGLREIDSDNVRTAPCHESALPPTPLRWHPEPLPDQGGIDFLSSLATMTTCGDALMQVGMATHVYAANASMVHRYFQNSDGELLIIPQDNSLRLLTELGILVAQPGEIVVIPRGIKFRVELPQGTARGFVCENYGQAFGLPERGPIGANGLANSRDFLFPPAAYEDSQET